MVILARVAIARETLNICQWRGVFKSLCMATPQQTQNRLPIMPVRLQAIITITTEYRYASPAKVNADRQVSPVM